MRVQWVPYGEPAARALAGAVARVKQTDPLQAVTVVVPTNSAGVTARRLLASGRAGTAAVGRGLAGIGFVTVYGLALRLGSAGLGAQGREAVSLPLVAAAVRGVLRDQPGAFAAVRDHPATVAGLADLHHELSGLDGAELKMLAALSPRGAEAVRVHRLVSAAVARWHTEAELMSAASTAALSGAGGVEEHGAVIVYLPQRLPPEVRRLLAALDRTHPVEVLAGSSGDPRADEDLGGQLGMLDRRVGPSPSAPPSPATQILSVSDPEEEIRHGVRQLVAAAERGVTFDRMALCYPSERPYARLAHEQLTAAGIPLHGPSPRPLRDRVAGRWVEDLLQLATGPMPRSAVLQTLTTAAAETTGQGHGRHGRWERISRDAGVVHGRGDFDRRLRAYADRLRRRADRVLREAGLALDGSAPAGEPSQSPQQCERRAASLRATAAETSHLRDDALELIDAVTMLHGASGWGELADRILSLLHRFLGSAPQRARWPADEQDAAGAVESVVRRLEVIDELDEPCTVAGFQQILGMTLDRDLGRAGRSGRGVMVGPLASAVGADLDVIVCVGLAEGVLPGRRREDALLPDRDRRQVGDALELSGAAFHRQHRHLRAALAAASGTRVLIHARSDLRDRSERTPSRWLLDHVEHLRGQVGDPDRTRHAVADRPDWLRRLPGPDADLPWFRHHASFAATVGDGQRPVTTQEWRLRHLGHEAAGTFAQHRVVRRDATLAANAEMLAARRRASFTRFDGDLATAADLAGSPSHTLGPISATALEDWVRCPHGYLLKHLLGVEPVDDPEELLQISALDRGSLLHEALERWLAGEISGGRVPPADRPWPASARRALLETFEAVCADYAERGLVGHDLLWRHDHRRILRDAEAFLSADDRWRQEAGATPTAVEIPFGMAGQPPAVVALGDGRTVALRGKIDRIDRTTTGAVVVTDYKSGRAEPYRSIRSGDDPTVAGSRLQLPLYALAARAVIEQPHTAVRAEYAFVTTRGGFQRVPLELTDAVMSRARTVLGRIVTAMEQGLFPQRPVPPVDVDPIGCASCEPDGLGRGRAWRAWLRAHSDPRLAGYADLVGMPGSKETA